MKYYIIENERYHIMENERYHIMENKKIFDKYNYFVV